MTAAPPTAGTRTHTPPAAGRRGVARTVPERRAARPDRPCVEIPDAVRIRRDRPSHPRGRLAEPRAAPGIPERALRERGGTLGAVPDRRVPCAATRGDPHGLGRRARAEPDCCGAVPHVGLPARAAGAGIGAVPSAQPGALGRPRTTLGAVVGAWLRAGGGSTVAAPAGERTGGRAPRAPAVLVFAAGGDRPETRPRAAVASEGRVAR